MAANATGHRQTDHLRIMALAEAAAHFAREVLDPGGSFLCKVLQGGTEAALLAELKRDFASVKHIKPPASRTDSAELYLLARGFRGAEAAHCASRAARRSPPIISSELIIKQAARRVLRPGRSSYRCLIVASLPRPSGVRSLLQCLWRNSCLLKAAKSGDFCNDEVAACSSLL